MCRAKPYPRCSSYAKKALESAKNAPKQDKDRIKKAQRAYDISPAGIQGFLDAGELKKAAKYQRIRDSIIDAAKRESEVKSDLKYQPFKVDYDPFLKEASKDIHLALDSLSAKLDGQEIIKQRKEQHERRLAEIEAQYKRDKEGKTPAETKPLTAQRRRDRAAAQTNWRQMEWLGFEFENALQEISANKVIEWNGPVYSYQNPGKSTNSKVHIDAWINSNGEKKPLDAKFHAWENSKGEPSYDVPLNDARAIRDCIKEHGVFYLLVAKADCEYDHDGSFKEWTYDLAGKKSSSSGTGKSRIRKTAANIREYAIYAIKEHHLPLEDGEPDDGREPMLKHFSQGKQQNGAARHGKYSLNIGKNGLIPIMKFTTPHGQKAIQQ